MKVNRKFLNKLADSIYNPKKKTFLRLCNGKLQNGPDPTNKKRPMHCGLGELYFVMTGKQPEKDGVCERDVIDRAVELSELETSDDVVEAAKAKIKKLGLPEDATQCLLVELDTQVNYVEEDDNEDTGTNELTPKVEAKFRRILSEIPDTNDDGMEEDVCTLQNYKARSRRVAQKLRAAAKCLPR